jgi:hypothetical protein
MIRILVTVGVALLATGSARAQSESQCEQIRQAVAQYGYEAARRHALANYGKEAVEAGDKCLKKRNSLRRPLAPEGHGRPPRS